MVQIINDPYSGNVLGRLGAGIGQGLSEQLPKEVERGRLSSGLKKLNQENIQDPFEFFTKAITIPGITPQMVQSLAELSKQRLKGQALKGFGQGAETPKAFPRGLAGEAGRKTEAGTPSITTPEGVEATVKPFIPRSTQEKLAAAAEKYEENPALFGNDPDKAIAFENQIDQDEGARNAAQQQQRAGETDVQNTIRSKLKEENANLGNLVPDTVYSKMEDEAIKSVLPISQGGKGLTEQAAAKEYAAKLKRISEDYSSISSFGKYPMFSTGRKELQRKLKNLQDRMIDRGEQKEFSEKLISDAHLSPFVALRIAYPVSADSKVVEELDVLPDLKAKGPIKSGRKRVSFEEQIPKIAQSMGKDSSPISVAEELESRGYDSNKFLNYLNENKDNLLTPWQADQLKYSNERPTLNDIYLFPDLFTLTGRG